MINAPLGHPLAPPVHRPAWSADPGILGDAARLAAVQRTGLLDAAREPALDRLSRLAARLLGTSVAAVSLVDRDRQYFAGAEGLDIKETDMAYSYCQFVVADEAPLVVNDTHLDARLAGHPATREHGHRAYIGVPLSVAPDAHVIGTLCVVAGETREWSPDDLATLETLGASVMAELRARAAMIQARDAAAALLREREFLVAVLDSLSEDVSVCGADGELTLFNRASVEIHGLPGDATLPPERWNAQHAIRMPDGVSPFPASELPHARARAEGRDVDGIEYVVAAAGRAPRTLVANARVLRDASGAAIGTVCAARDMTAQKAAERALAASERELRALFSAMQDVVLVLDGEGIYRRVVDTATDLLFRPPADLVGRRIADIFPPEQAATYLALIHRALASPEPVTGSYALEVPDGAGTRTAWFEAVVSALGDGTVLWVARDATARHAAERAAERTSELKDQLIGTASHELRGPLTAVRGALRLLGRTVNATDDPPAAALLQLAGRNVDRLLRLANDLLDIDRIEAGTAGLRLEALPICELVQAAFDIVEEAAGSAGIALDAGDTPMSAPAVWADADRIVQVLTNLIGNAIKFSPAGSTIRVGATTLPGGILSVSVRDEGRGIPADKLEAVFGRFEQVHADDARSKGGAGLGLAIVRAIVRQHGGDVHVASVPGAGSTFTCTLPTVDQETLVAHA